MKVPELLKISMNIKNKKLFISYFPENEKKLSYGFVELSEGLKWQKSIFWEV